MTDSPNPDAGQTSQPSGERPSGEPVPAATSGGAQAREKALALLRTAAAESREAARQTGLQFARLYELGRSHWQKFTGQRQSQEVMAHFGQRLFDLQLGNADLRSQYQQINERILNLQAAKSSTRKLEAERSGVQIRLAESFLSETPPAEVATEHAQAQRTAAQEREQQARLDQQRAALLPPDRPSRLRVGSGMLAILVLLLLLIWLIGPPLRSGTSLGPRADEIVGEWSGTHQLNMFGLTFKAGYTIEFRNDGRVRWESKVLEDTSGMTDAAKKMLGDTSANNIGTGKWRVENVEANTLVVRVVNDLEPDESAAFGWRITLESPQQMNIVNFEDVPITLLKDQGGKPTGKRENRAAVETSQDSKVSPIVDRLTGDHPDPVSGAGVLAFGALPLLCIGIIGILFYFVPTFVAASRKHPNTAAIAILNVFLGWTFVGYVVALVWSFMVVEPRGEYRSSL